jgi:hypothetical protein
VGVLDTGVNDADLGALSENPELVKSVDPGGVVDVVVEGRRSFIRNLDIDRGELDVLVEPDLDDIGQGSKSINVEVFGLHADTGEEVAVKRLDDLDAGSVGNLFLALP